MKDKKNIMEVFRELHAGENGERLNLDATYEWILNGMSYADFRKLSVLRFVEINQGYDFKYEYMIDQKHDCQTARKEYLQYLAYKLVQNLATPGVELRGIGYGLAR